MVKNEKISVQFCECCQCCCEFLPEEELSSLDSITLDKPRGNVIKTRTKSKNQYNYVTKFDIKCKKCDRGLKKFMKRKFVKRKKRKSNRIMKICLCKNFENDNAQEIEYSSRKKCLCKNSEDYISDDESKIENVNSDRIMKVCGCKNFENDIERGKEFPSRKKCLCKKSENYIIDDVRDTENINLADCRNENSIDYQHKNMFKKVSLDSNKNKTKFDYAEAMEKIQKRRNLYRERMKIYERHQKHYLDFLKKNECNQLDKKLYEPEDRSHRKTDHTCKACTSDIKWNDYENQKKIRESDLSKQFAGIQKVDYRDSSKLREFNNKRTKNINKSYGTTGSEPLNRSMYRKYDKKNELFDQDYESHYGNRGFIIDNENYNDQNSKSNVRYDKNVRNLNKTPILRRQCCNDDVNQEKYYRPIDDQRYTIDSETDNRYIEGTEESAESLPSYSSNLRKALMLLKQCNDELIRKKDHISDLRKKRFAIDKYKNDVNCNQLQSDYKNESYQTSTSSEDEYCCDACCKWKPNYETQTNLKESGSLQNFNREKSKRNELNRISSLTITTSSRKSLTDEAECSALSSLFCNCSNVTDESVTRCEDCRKPRANYYKDKFTAYFNLCNKKDKRKIKSRLLDICANPQPNESFALRHQKMRLN